MNIIMWFVNHFVNLFMNRKWKLPAKGKSGMIEPNWYPPAPLPPAPATIDAELVESTYHSDLFKQSIDKASRAYVKKKRDVLSNAKINEAIKLGAKKFFEEAYTDKDDNDVLLISGNLDIKEYMMEDFYKAYKPLCKGFGISLSFKHKAIWAKRDQLKSVFDRRLYTNPEPQIDEATRKLLQPGPYR